MGAAGSGANPKWKLYRVAVAASLAVFSCGMLFSWTSAALPKVPSELSITLSVNEESWVVSLINVGAIIGSLVGAFLVDFLGRKKCILLTCGPYLISWVLIFSARESWYLLLGRFVGGLSIGVSLNVVPMYLAEIAPTKLRGSLGSLTMTSINAGVLFQYMVGPFTSFVATAVISSLIPVLCFVTCIWMPESPHYLLMQNRQDEATRALQWLRGTQTASSIEKEVQEIRESLEEQQQNQLSLLQALKSPGNRRALLVVWFLGTMQAASGMAIILAYFQRVYDKTGSSLPAAYAYIFMGVLQVATVVLSTYAVDAAGRRPMMIISSVVVFLSHGVIGAYFFVNDYMGIDMAAQAWIPLAGIVGFVCAYNMGVAPQCLILAGEALAPEVRSVGGAGNAMCICCGAFIIQKVYPMVVETMGAYTPFWVFSALGLIAAIFTAKFVPETKGKSFAEIQKMFNREELDGVDRCNDKI